MKVRNLGIIAALTSTLGCASTNQNLTSEAQNIQRIQEDAIFRICHDDIFDLYQAEMQGPAMKLLSNPNDKALCENISVGVVMDSIRQCEANVRKLFESGVLSIDETKFNAVFRPLFKKP